MKCTRCKQNRKKILFSKAVRVQEKSSLVAAPELWKIKLCTNCVTDLFNSIWDQLSEDEEIKLTKKYGYKT